MKEREAMFTSEETDMVFRLSNCDRFFSLRTAYNGIRSGVSITGFFNRTIKKGFLNMAFIFLRDANDELLFAVTVGKNGKKADRLIPSDQNEAFAFVNLISQINEDQRLHCRGCNPKFKSCIVIELLRNYRKKLVISANS